MSDDFHQYLHNKLDVLKKAHLYRTLKNTRIIADHQIEFDGKTVINFSSNDYLGLSQHPQVIQAGIDAIKKYGTGSGASRLISGNREYHLELEKDLARFKDRERALLFGSGYLANLALLSCLPTPKDLVLSDELNHASIIDGCRMSRAEVINYPHCDINWIKSFLERHREKYKQVFIVSDSVFSMDGDIIPLRELYNLADDYECVVILDEAHSTGVLGKQGRGIESHFNCTNQRSIIMGTLGKALGSYGAFVCGSEELIEYLINRARTFIYSTALPPSVILTSHMALNLLREDPTIHQSLSNNLQMMNNVLKTYKINTLSHTAIFPVLIGKSDCTMKLSSELLSKGFYIQGIRPPTVPKGKSRLRITVSSIHNKNDIFNMINALSDTIKSSL